MDKSSSIKWPANVHGRRYGISSQGATVSHPNTGLLAHLLSHGLSTCCNGTGQSSFHEHDCAYINMRANTHLACAQSYCWCIAGASGVHCVYSPCIDNYDAGGGSFTPWADSMHWHCIVLSIVQLLTMVLQQIRSCTCAKVMPLFVSGKVPQACDPRIDRECTVSHVDMLSVNDGSGAL